MLRLSPFLRWFRCLLGVASLHLTSLAARAEWPSSEEVARTATWFDSLDWPHVRGKPYVEVTFGKGYGGVKNLMGSYRGFLMAEDEESFSIVADGTDKKSDEFSVWGWPLTVQQFSRLGWEGKVDPEIRYRVIDLETAVKEVLSELRRRKEEKNEWPESFGNKILRVRSIASGSW